MTDRPFSAEVEDEDPFPQPKPGEDVFLLTGTTFAGATDMNSTAGATDTRPGTDQTTRMGARTDSVLAIERMGEVDEEGAGGDSNSSSARHSRLLIEAELRAEHQAQARTTMLELATALDVSQNKSRDLAARLRVEYDANVALRKGQQALQDRVEYLEEECEKVQAKALCEKADRLGNKMFFSQLIEKSREVFEISALCPLKEGSRQQPSAGDNVMIKWAIKFWFKEVAIGKEARKKEIEAAERKRELEEQATKARAEREKAVEEVRKTVRGLEGQLEKAQALIEESRGMQQRFEGEIMHLNATMAREASAAKAREEQLKAEVEDVKQDLEKSLTALAEIQAEYEASQEALKSADAAFSSERTKLQSIIRQVNSELQEAMVLAKHMRETALQAKRAAAGSVSPSKFAELIAQLEGMKNALAIFTKDAQKEKDSNAWLFRKLDRNTRQLELERQFLPLLRKVRGPVGPKQKGNDETKRPATQASAQAPQNMMPPLAGQTSPSKLRMSQSMGALTDNRAATAGPGGRPSGGFQDDQTRFASSLGFAGSNQGSPIRG